MDESLVEPLRMARKLDSVHWHTPMASSIEASLARVPRKAMGLCCGKREPTMESGYKINRKAKGASYGRMVPRIRASSRKENTMGTLEQCCFVGLLLKSKAHHLIRLGVYVWPSGKKFVGRWAEGVKNGHGLYTWPNGKKYDGEYKHGLKHGYGRMSWPNGQSYSGGFEHNQRSGRGVQSSETGDIIHCGMWKNDAPVGESSQDLLLDDCPVPSMVTIDAGTTDVSLSPARSSSSSHDQERDISSPAMAAQGDDEDDVQDHDVVPRNSIAV
jgi:hypothetical protein